MTLIAFATHGKRADIITDTFAYTHSARDFSRSYKPLHLPHLDDLVVLTQGSSIFGRLADVQATELADHLPSFDLFVDEAPQAWREVHERADVLLSRGRCRFWDLADHLAIASDRDPGSADRPGPRRSPDLHNTTDRPATPRLSGGLAGTAPEHGRRWRVAREAAETAEAVSPIGDVANEHQARALSGLARMAASAVPTRRKDARERALLDPRTGAKILVGGKLWHTRLSQGMHTTRLAYTFNDSGKEFQRMVAGTLHPQGQLGPCLCGSGDRYLDCCLAGLEDEPCDCGSRKVFRDCCRVASPQGSQQSQNAPVGGVGASPGR